MTIQELREKRSKAWDTARDFLDSKRNESGLLSEADSKTYDAMEQQIVAYGKEIQRLERQAQIEAEMNKPTSTPIQDKPNAAIHGDTKTGIASDAYRTAFWNSIRNRNFYDVRNDLQVGTDTEGGYLVPSEFERKLVEALTEENIFRQLATVIKTSSGDRKIPIVTSKGEAAWMDEEDAYKLSDDTFGQASLGAYKVGTAIKISEELLNDAAFDLPSYIAKEFARRIGAKEEEAFFIGDGKGKPTGIFAATGGAESGATTSTANITFDDVLELLNEDKLVFKGDSKKEYSGKIVFTNDGTHPTYDGGHPIYTKTLSRSLLQMNKAQEKAHALKAPLYPGNYEKAKMIPVTEFEHSEGWKLLSKDDKAFSNFQGDQKALPVVLESSDSEDFVKVHFKGIRVGVFDLIGPSSGGMTVEIDQNDPSYIRRFDKYCGDRNRTNYCLFESLNEEEHTIIIRPDNRRFEKAEIYKMNPKRIKETEYFNEFNTYLGYILLVGDIIQN